MVGISPPLILNQGTLIEQSIINSDMYATNNHLPPTSVFTAVGDRKQVI